MRVRLGIDTGGTYTDAVLLDAAGEVVAAAKAVTTRDDLARGIGAALRQAMALLPDGVAYQVELVGLSTTLATNAIVEGRGGSVGLLLAGLGADVVKRAGLAAVLGNDPVALLQGGHDAHGSEAAPLDEPAAAAEIRRMAGKVQAFAITARFSVRNPAHEVRLARLVAELTGLPVTMGHELSARLDAPRRALTTVLNARLIPEIARLLEAAEALMRELGITAPLMVVRGDGSLMRAEQVRLRPVETILSGPAASVVGAARLADLPHAMIADVGGTTTDIALLEGGRPHLRADGAIVGGYRTMVEAIELRTLGLGGDSALGRDAADALTLGPRRDVPVSMLAHDNPGIMVVLQEQARRRTPREHDARFAFLARPLAGAANRDQARLAQLLAQGPVPLEVVIDREHLKIALQRMVERGEALLSGFTPSDAAHCQGLQATWSVPAALLAAHLEARKGWQGGGEAPDAKALADSVLALARRLTARALAAAATGEDEPRWLDAPPIRAALDGKPVPGLLGASLALACPIVAVGGPARILYPEAANRLGTPLVLPPHHEVCNAIGAVVGDVVRRDGLSIVQVGQDRHAVQLGEERVETADVEAAVARASAHLEARVRAAFDAAGGAQAHLTIERTNTSATLDGGREMVVEVRLEATARGRPSLLA